MPNTEVLREARGRSPSAQRDSTRSERRGKPGGGAERERRREKRRSSASRKRKRRQPRDREPWPAGASEQPGGGRKVALEERGSELQTLVEYDDVSSQSERFSGSPSPKLDPHIADRLSVDLLSDNDFGYNGPASPDGRRYHQRDRDAVLPAKDAPAIRGPSERTRPEREPRRKEQQSHERDASKVRGGSVLSGSKNRDSSRSSDRNGKKSSAAQPPPASAEKGDVKRHKSTSRSDRSEKEPPSAYREAPQSYREDREELRGSHKRSPGLKSESPYGTSYPYGYQSPGGYNQPISRKSPTYGNKRLSPSSAYYSRDPDFHQSYGASKSPSSYSSSNKRKRSPTSPATWRRSPSYGRHSPYEQGEFGNRKSRSPPYRKSLSPSPEVR